jgi:predicted enzyme related to lactoylglutathione lyase
MANQVKTIIYPVKDVSAAKAILSAMLDAEPIADEPYYVGFNVGGQDIGLDPSGHSKGLSGAVPYWHVDDIEKRFEALLAAGATEVQPVSSVGGGRRIASVKDADGNLFGILQG